MDTSLFRCPTCNAIHEEPLEAVIGIDAVCFPCAVEAAGLSTTGTFADPPCADLPIAA